MRELIKKLSDLGIKLLVNERNELIIRAPHSVMTDELLSEIKKYKNELISYLSIKPISRDMELPLSYAQERLWFIDQLEPNSSAYNLPGAIRLRGEIKPEILIEAFTRIIKRHENLRTVFQTRESRPVQVIKAPEEFNMQIIDLTDISEEEKEIKAKQIATKEAQTPFNLSEGPLLRAKLIKMVEGDYIIVVNMHHIISDGWSIGILIQEIGKIIEALLKKEEPQLPPLP